MNKNLIDKFSPITIRGRFIYGYLCLLNSIDHYKLIALPFELTELFQEFVSSNRLDEWHTKVEDVLPSFVLDVDEVNNEYFPLAVVDRIKEYYSKQPSFFVDLIENLFWLGISNLYVAYSSENSLKYLKLILEMMIEHSIPLPDFEKVKDFYVTQSDSWGKQDDLKKY